jgi:hypothetical protein
MVYGGIMQLVLWTVVAVFFAQTPANAIAVEFLRASINSANVTRLEGIACRNYNHIVHLDIAVDWPQNSLIVERRGYRRLIFWDSSAEYLFPNGSFMYRHGSYVIGGYFIARSGGVHQGVVSNAFEKINAAQVRPELSESKTTSGACP